jgi:hypothetical protein
VKAAFFNYDELLPSTINMLELNDIELSSYTFYRWRVGIIEIGANYDLFQSTRKKFKISSYGKIGLAKIKGIIENTWSEKIIPDVEINPEVLALQSKTLIEDTYAFTLGLNISYQLNKNFKIIGNLEYVSTPNINRNREITVTDIYTYDSNTTTITQNPHKVSFIGMGLGIAYRFWL